MFVLLNKKLIFTAIIFGLLLTACGTTTNSSTENINSELLTLANSSVDTMISYYEDGEELNVDILQDMGEYYKEYDMAMSTELNDDEAVLLKSVSELSVNMIMHSTSGETMLEDIDKDLKYVKGLLNK